MWISLCTCRHNILTVKQHHRNQSNGEEQILPCNIHNTKQIEKISYPVLSFPELYLASNLLYTYYMPNWFYTYLN